MKSISEIDLAPKPDKKYWKNCHREWREEFIYFLMVDRFHDNMKRHPINFDTRHHGFGDCDQLHNHCGGTLRGITRNLDYIKDLGCTAIWLSPVFKNNQGAYHGYAIEDYLEVDEHFGTSEELEELVERAHSLDLLVFLDIVLHHSGDNWFYTEGQTYSYSEGNEYPFGGWRSDDKPKPIELRNPSLYNKKGEITNYEAYPETIDGDFFGLKAFKCDDTREGIYVQKLLTAIHCYWIRETDIDGFRLDAVKHTSPLFISRFCSSIREYAYSLGKRNFFLFGEVIGNDDVCSWYVGPKTQVTYNDQNIYAGLNSSLDFSLYFLLEQIIKGKTSPGKLIERYVELQKFALERGEYGEYLVTFLDNHDQVGKDYKHRFGYDAEPAQIIAGIAFLLCALGTPCIYYGTEQGLNGCGKSDDYVRECMFDINDRNSNILNKQSGIYKAISGIAKFRQNCEVLRFGRMFIREISSNGIHFHLPDCPRCTLAFSRILFDKEVVFVYNSSISEAKEECILIDSELNKNVNELKVAYGKKSSVVVQRCSKKDGGTTYIKMYLKPTELVILKNY